jgi:hypothetical protein
MDQDQKNSNTEHNSDFSLWINKISHAKGNTEINHSTAPMLTAYMVQSSFMLLSNYMHCSPSLDDDSCSAGQEIPHLLWNLKFHCVHNGPPLDPILCQLNSAHTLASYFFKIHFNIILPEKHPYTVQEASVETGLGCTVTMLHSIHARRHSQLSPHGRIFPFTLLPCATSSKTGLIYCT